MQALSIKGLTKIYNNGVVALKGIDLSVNQGDFFALLGPNGAGKSTTIGIIASLINKSGGEVKVFGHSLDTALEAAKACIGLVPQELNFSIFEKVIDVIVYQAGYYGVPPKLAKQRAETYLKKLDLWDKRDQVSMRLSGGMKRRLMIARALVHEPKLLILDEPTAGVDIEIRRSMWEFLQTINHQGTTIILTTHYLEEAEYLCKNIAIIDKGSIIENTSMKNLLATLNMETFVFDLKVPLKTLPKEVSPFAMRLLDNRTLEVDVAKEQSLNNLFGFLEGHHIEVTSLRNKANRLEELFLNLIAANKKE
ncbi:MAG: ABC transporter ATP-binding protein [Pseudomonadota bacterium]